MNLTLIRLRRRNVVVGAGLGLAAAVLAACTASAKEKAAPPAASPAVPGAPAGALTKTSDVPVGSGVIVGDIVVTQPTAGTFEGFSTVCPHAGCNVNKVTDGLIVCPCHGSEFKLDGSVAKGPAKEPLTAKAVKVQGDSIVAG